MHVVEQADQGRACSKKPIDREKHPVFLLILFQIKYGKI
jgi:hypothetical protein